MSFFNQGALNRAANAYNAAITPYQSINPNVATQTATDAFQSLDPTGTDAEKQAMGELQQEYSTPGLTEQSKDALQATQLSNAQQAGAATQAALNNAARSGTLNSGRAISGVLGAGQNAADANAQAGATVASNDAALKNQALTNSAGIGANLTGQAQQTAQGENQANQFNTGQENQMAQQNLANQFTRAGGIASGETNLGNFNSGQAQQANQMADTLGSSLLGGTATALSAGLRKSDARAKDNIVRLSQEALPGVPFATWTWKPEHEGSGPTFGVIAQDLAAVAPEFVSVGPDGFLRVNYSFLKG